jgi:peptide deformylase
MAFRNVLSWPNPALKKKSESIKVFDSGLIDLAKDLYDTLNVVTGVGIAAPQVGVHKRCVIIDTSQCNLENPAKIENFPENILVLVNPVIKLSGPKHRWVEACLSVPDSTGHVERSQLAEVNFQSLDGSQHNIELDWPASGVFQHEIDHLDGILYVDRMNRIARDMLLKKITKKRKRMAKFSKMMKEQEANDLAGIDGVAPPKRKTSSSSTKKRKKRAPKKNHVSKKRRKK